MVIHEMSREECLEALSHARLARLGCAKDNQPYIVPVFFTFDQAESGDGYLYGFTTVGQKTEWMRANPRVCVELDEVATDDHWTSLVAIGRYEELSENVEQAPDYQRAIELLQEHAMWWEPGVAVYADKAYHDGPRPFMPIFYRIKIDHVTGHRCCGTPAAAAAPDIAKTELRLRGWLRRLLRRVGLKFTN